MLLLFDLGCWLAIQTEEDQKSGGHLCHCCGHMGKHRKDSGDSGGADGVHCHSTNAPKDDLGFFGGNWCVVLPLKEGPDILLGHHPS